jgi:photosystem II stability/assembly factor-like uncharacterized protein
MKKTLCLLLVLPFLFFNCTKEYPTDPPFVENLPFLNSFPYENSDLKIDLATGHLPYSTKQFYFSDETNGVSLTNAGEVYTTKDKAMTWKKAYGSSTEFTIINDLKVIDKLIFIACGYVKTDLGVLNGFIAKTIDGGETWQTVQKTPKSEMKSVTVGENNTLYALNFSSDSLGRNTIVFKSSNLGQTWDAISTLVGEDGYNIYYISKSRLSMRSYRSIRLISSDSGKTWTSGSPANIFPTVTIGFNFGQGYGISQSENNYDISKTTDDGERWAKSFSSTAIPNKINVVSPTTVLLCGNNMFSSYSQQKNYNSGYIVYSLDAGNKWKELSFSCDGFALSHFYNEKQGYIYAGTLFKVSLK